MARIKNHRRPVAEINVVPYIDVMLVLLIIFMITAPLITPGVHVDLPQTNANPLPSEADEQLVITVNRLGEFYFNFGENQDQPIADEALMLEISAALKHTRNSVVMVRGDNHVNYGRVVHAMVLAQFAGAASVGLITEPTEKN